MPSRLAALLRALPLVPRDETAHGEHLGQHEQEHQPGEFVWTGGDVHIYANHEEQVREQLSREPYPYPRLRLRRTPASIFDYDYEDFEVLDYRHHPTITAPIAV